VGTARRSSQANGLYKTKDPIVAQLIGARDNVASPLDQVDIAVDGHDPSSEPQDRRYFFVEMANTDHEHAGVFSNTSDGDNRRNLFLKALTQPPDQLHPIARDPSLLADDIPQRELDVTDTVFIMHGIRDDGFWTHRIAKQVREHAKSAVGEGAMKLGADERRSATDRELAREDARELELSSYFDTVAELLLKSGLRTSEPDTEVREIARAYTLAVVLPPVRHVSKPTHSSSGPMTTIS
jgi:hypothetical protein